METSKIIEKINKMDTDATEIFHSLNRESPAKLEMSFLCVAITDARKAFEMIVQQENGKNTGGSNA